MALIKLLWDMLLIVLLLTSLLLVCIGSLWVLRVAIDWWLNVDYVEVIKRWIHDNRL